MWVHGTPSIRSRILDGSAVHKTKESPLNRGRHAQVASTDITCGQEWQLLRLSATPSHAAIYSTPLPHSLPRLTSSPDALPAAYRGPCSSTRTAFGLRARLLRKWRNLDIPRPPQCTIEFVHPFPVNQMRIEWCRSTSRATIYVDRLRANFSE